MILVDGKRTAAIDALDRGLAYGDGVFRTMRAQSGRILYWPQHCAKLQADCARLGIDCPAASVLVQDVDEVLRDSPDCVVKIIVTRGRGGRGYAAPEPAMPIRVVARFPLPAPRPGCDEHGVRVRWCTLRLGTQPQLAGIKHLNRLENVLARREWSDPGIAEGLLRDQAGYVIEGTATNLFILESGRLVTARLDACGVAGVQRDRLLAFAAQHLNGCTIDALTPERVLAADQIYLVNSVTGLWWVSALEGRDWTRCDLTLLLLRWLETDD